MTLLLPRRLPVLLAAAAAALVVATDVAAQDLHPSRRPSPVGIAKAHLNGTYAKVTYGRPYMRDRAIFGDPSGGDTFLVPFGEMWRTGANEATEITVTGPVRVAGQSLPAGTWSIFTTPGPETWTVRFNAQLGMDGTGRLDPSTGTFTPSYDASEDVLVVDVPVHSVVDDVEQFTIAFEPVQAPTHLVLRWERTEVRLPIEPM
jgi:hypothetical protein